MDTSQKFWIKIKELQKAKQKYKKELILTVDSQKILRAVDLCLDNRDILEGGCCLYQKNKLVRMATNFIINYCLQQYKKYTPSSQ